MVKVILAVLLLAACASRPEPDIDPDITPAKASPWEGICQMCQVTT